MQFICSWVQLLVVQASCVILFWYSLMVSAVIMFVPTNIWGMCYRSVCELSTNEILLHTCIWLQNFSVLIIKLKSHYTSTFYTVTVFFYAVLKHCHIKICMLFYPAGVGIYIWVHMFSKTWVLFEQKKHKIMK
jgi:hypothetical protein